LLLVDAMGLAFRQYFGCKKQRHMSFRTLLFSGFPCSAVVPCICFCCSVKNRHSPLLAAMKDPPISSSADAAIAALTAASGPIPTSFTPRDVGALYGYASSLLNLCYVLQPTHVAACMDLGNKQSFRHALFPGQPNRRGRT
jgi:5'-3' exonuclease